MSTEPQVQGRGWNNRGRGRGEQTEREKRGDEKVGVGEEGREGGKWGDLQRQHLEQQLQQQERQAAGEEPESEGPDFLGEAQLRLIPAFVYRNYEALAAMAATEIESEVSAVTCPFEAYTIKRVEWCKDVMRKYYCQQPAFV